MADERTGTRVVVLNQHGDNRGDEAAMTAMVRGLGDRLPGASFTIVHQFNDEGSQIDLDPPVRYVGLRLPPLDYVRLALHTVLRMAGLRFDRLLGRRARPIVEAIDQADLVVSAPGGPYFGDLYADHEAVHWLLVWVAHRAGKPLGLYAPSCGPFGNRALNPIRRRGFRWFDAVALREQRSADLLRELTGIEAVVTTDSALQDSVPAASRDRYAAPHERLLVVAVRDPGADLRARHDEAVVAAVEALAARRPTAVVFLPQLHGSRTRDAPYLTALSERVQGASAVRVLPETTDSTQQRACIAAADLVVAGRYHPAVFSISAGTPVLVIAYEHKAMGVAEAAGIARHALWLDDIDADRLIGMAVALDDEADDVRRQLGVSGPQLRELSGRTSDLMAGLVSR
jgi:colanic acid/amylovoran biosynthesis protein